MNKSFQEKAGFFQDKPLNQIRHRKPSIEQAMEHLLGVCLIDITYTVYLPAQIRFSLYGKYTFAMISQGMGIDAIVRGLEDCGLTDAQSIFSSALKSVPDNANLSGVFLDAFNVIQSHDK